MRRLIAIIDHPMFPERFFLGAAVLLSLLTTGCLLAGLWAQAIGLYVAAASACAAWLAVRDLREGRDE